MTVEPIRKLLPFLSIAVLVAALYVAYTFYSRHDQDRKLEDRKMAKEVEADQDTIRRIGGAELKITVFYANPNLIGKGETAQLCYGVANAAKVTLEPPVERVWPSLSHCFSVSPRVTTRYTLIAWDQKGKTAQQSAELAVH